MSVDAIDAQPEEITFSSVDLAQLGGATYRQVDYWARRGWLPETASGSGSQRRFTADDLTFVRYTVSLLGHDIALARAVELARLLVTGHEITHTVGDVELTVRPVAATQPAQEAQA